MTAVWEWSQRAVKTRNLRDNPSVTLKGKSQSCCCCSPTAPACCLLMSLSLSELWIPCAIPAPGPAVSGEIPISKWSTLCRSSAGSCHFPCQKNMRAIDAISLPFRSFLGWTGETFWLESLLLSRGGAMKLQAVAFISPWLLAFLSSHPTA